MSSHRVLSEGQPTGILDLLQHDTNNNNNNNKIHVQTNMESAQCIPVYNFTVSHRSYVTSLTQVRSYISSLSLTALTSLVYSHYCQHVNCRTDIGHRNWFGEKKIHIEIKNKEFCCGWCCDLIHCAPCDVLVSLYVTWCRTCWCRCILCNVGRAGERGAQAWWRLQVFSHTGLSQGSSHFS